MLASTVKSLIRKIPGFGNRLSVNIHFNDGPFLEIASSAEPHRVVMRCAERVVHTEEIAGQHWTSAHQRFYTPWTLEVFNQSGQLVFRHDFDLRNRVVRINIDSRSLGDTLAWLPQVQAFARKHPQARVHLSHFWPDLFDNGRYPELTFIEPDYRLEDCYATYHLGYYFENSSWHHPEDPRLQPLGKIAADILGVTYEESRPHLACPEETDRDNHSPLVCIATASTAKCKHWLFPNGWQCVVDHLKGRGFEVVIVQREPSDLHGVIDETGDRPIGERISRIAGCRLFIGLGSGLSWLAWALDKPVVLISGFSQPYTEFTDLCERVINTDVCHGCWNDTGHAFDRDDWNWCPRHAGTDRAFECSAAITPEMVIEAIDRRLANQRRYRN